jgi:dipeptidyl aminopeptidase/acylaminoacyl peptidase
MKKLLGLFLCLVSVQATSAQNAKQRPIAVDDLFTFRRVADPQISPDGKRVVYVLGTVDLAANRTSSSLWLLSAAGGEPRQLTNSTKSDRHPRWSPDGNSILFESNRSGESQLWIIGVHGGEARQLTHISTGASQGIWSRDGRRIAFVSAVWPEYSHKSFKESDALNKKRIDAQAKDPVKARVFTRLFFRHWNEYVEDKRQHLFVAEVQPKAGSLEMIDPRDVTPGDYDAYPTSTTFSVGDDFTFSPDSAFLLYTAVPKEHEAWSTNHDIWRVPATGGRSQNLTQGNKAADGAPRFSADGTLLAYRAQKRPGNEADRWQLQVVACNQEGALQGKPRSVTAGWDGSVEEFVWGPDNNTLFFTAEASGGTPIFEVTVDDGAVAKLHEGHTNGSLSISRDGNIMAFTQAALHQPAEVRLASYRKIGKGTAHNAALLSKLKMPRPESVTVKGAGGTPMQMWILKPPGFDAGKKWPLVYLVHGGPQGAWADGWSYRWNPQVWAAQGYVVALPNPRGSTGFGQKYVDEISGDWGGKCFDDLMAGVAFLEKQPYIDPDRMASAGASFGGYMMNWFAVKTGKFKTLISHCGVWNFDSMYATTEELWFDEWEHGGPPWGKRESYEKYSPHRLATNLGKFRTPMLIIQNDLDFRVPVSEGIQLFTTLQRLGVPARMINFPDEGHWVLKPRNSQFWHREVFSWLKKHVPAGGQ